MKILTHVDFDGLISAYLLKRLHPEVKEVVFINHNEIQLSTEEDIVADLPMPEKFSQWYDHHENTDQTKLLPGKTFWNPQAPSAARIILTKNIKQFTKEELPRIVELVFAADKIDTGQFSQQHTPEEIISITLLTGNKQRDCTYKQYLLSLLEQGMSLKEISQQTFVQKELEFKEQMTLEECEKITQQTIMHYGTKFITLKSENRISKTAMLKIFKETKTDYIIAHVPHIKEPEKKALLVMANPYQQNVVHLSKLLKTEGSKRNKEYIALLKVLPEKEQELEKEIIEKIATHKKIIQEVSS